MRKSEDITEQEAAIIKSSIIYIEAGDHLITDEAKRHKLALMLACALVLMLSIFPSSEVSGLFGIIKFKDGNEIKAYTLLPYAIFVMLYQGIMYAYHFSEAKKAWVNKLTKLSSKDNIIELNSLSNEISDAKHIYIDSLPENQSHDSITKINNNRISLQNTIYNYEQSIQDIPEHLTVEYIIKDIFKELANTQLIAIESRNYDNLTLVKQFNILDNQIDKLNKLLVLNENIRSSINGVKQCNKIINELSQELDNHFISKYNYYLEETFQRNNKHGQIVKEAIEQRERLIKKIERTSFCEKKAILLYKILPLLFFGSAFTFGLFTYLTNT